MKLSKGTTRLVAQGTGTCIFGEDTNRVSTGLLPGCDAARCSHWQCRGFSTSWCMCCSFFRDGEIGVNTAYSPGVKTASSPPSLHYS